MRVWLNGALLDADDARIAPGDRGFTLGDGLFETLAVRAGTISRLPAHLARLAAGAQVLGLPLPAFDLPQIAAALLQANGWSDAVLRLTVTRGVGPRGVLPPDQPSPTVLVTAAPMAAPGGPARLVTATVTRRNEHSPLSRIKSLNYLDNILARQEAHTLGADDALLLNTQGRLAESTIANVFLVLDGTLVTPPLGEGALPGVMRAEVLAHGAVERPVSVADLQAASEIFLTSSLGVRSVHELAGRALSSQAAADALRRDITP
ncbi:aminotransferase class IV [Azorhizobium sp. AG788]|uniref:aminotransferase class IV n=1 Tax=Azorhizobium sp. AG788 TaxID=2183897 RepID=UPI003139A318